MAADDISGAGLACMDAVVPSDVESCIGWPGVSVSKLSRDMLPRLRSSTERDFLADAKVVTRSERTALPS